MKIDVLTLFPKMFTALNESVIGKAQEKGLLEFSTHDFRNYAQNKQHHVDDYPYGGGAGMLLQVEPIDLCLEEVVDKEKKPRVILLDPSGVPFNQALAEDFAKEEQLIFICGHYEGYDERIRDLVTDEVSLGDYVLTGGELGAMVMIDATVRLLPNVLGNQESAKTDSHSTGLLEHPQYTRPAEYKGKKVPAVLMSGNHEKIRQWKVKESLRRTYLRRPDMLEKYSLNEEEAEFLAQIKEEVE
ncbi:tRNA (guanosine(37)-N1)-methyltransferase TrmD [Catellicoccus marimammalium]|uniref:tRNA (guanine-N(1)-)-methyltransferase n=1 Tax=Catellicoccus marimammalium M35/04/3 TaxID=1234409 RepID=K8ZPH2_9ENTE|nr:tRNA (guanosine(37)-N1)-methyltransferase TrmD [Catellicoccus marimammalium]EKU27471.1 tRNA (Guanine37-N1) -methyltransferase [Catellicoccus marimammalium M35/04/3]